MFCPVCKDEFREGFTRCEGCEADLVEQLGDAPVPENPGGSANATGHDPERARRGGGRTTMIDFCGFFQLDEARRSRATLRDANIASEIVIRDSPGEPPQSAEEEYWLRVEAASMAKVSGLLGYDAAESTSGEGTFSCGDCGGAVNDQETFCPNCGARFDEE